MSLRTKIKELANSKSYSRGLSLFQMGHVLQFSAEENEDGIEVIECLVQGSGRNRYDVYLMWDPIYEEVIESGCDCLAFQEYDGICKHCVAAMLAYEREQKMRHPSYSLEKMLGGKGIQKGIQRKTTPSIRRLLEKEAIAKSLPLIQEDTCGKVRLEPHIRVDNTGVNLQFRIGAGKMYVLKDVFAFVEQVKAQENYSYGKNLQFIHAMESFTEQTRPLVSFLVQWAEKNRYRYGGYSVYGVTYGMAKAKEIELSGSELEQFLNLMKDQELLVSFMYEEERLWTMSQQEPERRLQILGKKDGIEVQINLLRGIRGERYHIYFSDGEIFFQEKEKMKPVEAFLDCMEEIPDRTIFIERRDVPLFCKEMLPQLETFFVCTKVDFDETEYGVAQPLFTIYLDAPQPDMVTCVPKVTYGEQSYDLFGTKDLGIRDLGKEGVLRKLVQRYADAYDQTMQAFVVVDEEKIYELLTEGILAFQKAAEVYVSETLKKIEVHTSPKVSVGVSIDRGWLELKMTAGDMSREELLELLSRYDKKKKYYRLKDGSFVQKEDDSLDVLADLKESLQLNEQQLKQETIRVEKYRALYLDGQLREHPEIIADRDKSFRGLVRTMKTVEDNDFEVPQSLENTLRSYQKYGFRWLKTLAANGFGGILADDMGLGKTLQVISYLLSEYQERQQEEGEKGHQDQEKQRNTLIVAPASLVYNWCSELERFAPELPVRMILGTAAQRNQLLQEAGREDILITSYDLLRRDVEHYKEYEFRCQIIDEAQYIKNHTTQSARAVKKIQAETRFALTGTPVENRLSELWSIFDYLMPGFLYSYTRFRQELEVLIVQEEDEDARERLRRMIRPFVLRRLKKDVLQDLPDKLEENKYSKLEGEQQKLYDAHVKRLKMLLDKQSDEEFRTSKIVVLSELTRLRQICCDPALLFEGYQGESVKLELCLELIRNAVENGHKILIFSQFTTMLDRLAQRLDREKLRYYMLTGSVGKEKRAKMVEQFQTDDTPIFCISLKAGGTGLNLTAADMVIHYDPWWNLAVQNQATDRAHRIGQKNVVNVYKLIAKDTIEENIVKLQEKKHALADQILSGEDMGSGSFSREEILELLGG